MLRFITNLAVVPVSRASACHLRISVTALVKGDGAAPAAQTFLFVDVESADAGLAGMFGGSVVLNGSVAVATKGAGFYGGLWQLAAVGDAGEFAVEVATPLVLANVGLCEN